MARRIFNLKEEIMDLVGSLSVEELVTNIRVQEVIGEIHSELNHVSALERKFCQRREQN